MQRALQRWRLDGGELAPDGGDDLAPGGKDPVPPVAPVQRPAWGAVVVLAVAVALVVLALLA